MKRALTATALVVVAAATAAVGSLATASPASAAPPNPCVYYYDQEHAESYYVCLSDLL